MTHPVVSDTAKVVADSTTFVLDLLRELESNAVAYTFAATHPKLVPFLERARALRHRIKTLGESRDRREWCELCGEHHESEVQA